jgi:ABC-type branched-subunit amino acid transport system ATPase component
MVSEVAAGEALLRIEDLTKRFGGVVALAGCSLDVEKGKITGLIGPNGSGKTTLFNLITGFIRPDSGTVTFAGEPVTGLPPDQIHRRGIGRTFQLARIFPRLTVFENMLVPLSERGLRAIVTGISAGSETSRVHDTLDFLGIAHLAGQPAGRLSYGQRKLLEFGALLMTRPALTLLDEPAGGVNPSLLEMIGDRIRQLNSQGMTFLVVDHNMPFVMDLCHSVSVVDSGRVIASGSPQAVSNDPTVLEAYLGGPTP